MGRRRKAEARQAAEFGFLMPRRGVKRADRRAVARRSRSMVHRPLPRRERSLAVLAATGPPCLRCPRPWAATVAGAASRPLETPRGPLSPCSPRPLGFGVDAPARRVARPRRTPEPSLVHCVLSGTVLSSSFIDSTLATAPHSRIFVACRTWLEGLSLSPPSRSPAMSTQQTVCCECGRSAPEANTTETLVSKTGWRLTRTRGTALLEWRCPACWAERKAALAASASTSWPARR